MRVIQITKRVRCKAKHKQREAAAQSNPKPYANLYGVIPTPRVFPVDHQLQMGAAQPRGEGSGVYHLSSSAKLHHHRYPDAID